MLRQLTDDDLLLRLESLVAQERSGIAEIIEHLAEVDRREIIPGKGYESLFDYCRKKLHYSESAAFLRIRAARAATQFPRVLEDLRSGNLHLDAVMRLYPHLTEDNCTRVLDQAQGASKREIMELAAALAPAEAAVERDVVRFLPPQPRQTDPGPAEVIPPPSRVRLSFTADELFLASVERLRSLCRHKHPDGRLEDLLKDAVVSMLSRIDPERKPSRQKPFDKRPPKGRRIAADVKAAVWRRDGGRCAYVSEDGRRCESGEFLEYDHVRPWSLGGKSEIGNLRLLCRAHNQWLARRRFGPRRRAQLRPDAPVHG